MAETGIPGFRSDGYLPEGVHLASGDEIILRFGTSNRRRRSLTPRLKHWTELARLIGATRLLIDGSFVTAAEYPYDVDAVILLPQNFSLQLDQEAPAALELE